MLSFQPGKKGFIFNMLTRLCDYYCCKNDDFQMKNCDIFSLLIKINIEVESTVGTEAQPQTRLQLHISTESSLCCYRLAPSPSDS